MFERTGSFLKSLRLHPYGARFFLAWSIVACVSTGSIALLLTDFLPQTLAGTSFASAGTTLKEFKSLLIAAAALFQLILHSWLIFPSLPRWILWNLLLFMTWGISWIESTERDQVQSGGSRSGSIDLTGLVVLAFILFCFTLVFLHERKRPWLGIAIGVSAPFIFHPWITRVAPRLIEWAEVILEPTPSTLYVVSLNMGAFALHSILTGAILAWLMPPCSDAPKAPDLRERVVCTG